MCYTDLKAKKFRGRSKGGPMREYGKIKDYKADGRKIAI